MKTNHITQQAFNDQRVARYSTPSDTIVMERGKPWARNLGIVCPGCGVVFYGWQCQERMLQDGYMDPEPPISESGIADGRRRTCGHPACEAGEDKHQMGRSPAYLRTCEAYFTAKESEGNGVAKPRPTGLKRLG